MAQSPFYINLTKKDKELALGFLTTCLLRSRGDMKFLSNSEGYDEDVNVYLAHLLVSLLDAGHAERTRKYVSKNDQDIFKLIEESNDITLKHEVYRVNADNLLISIGIFNNLGTSFRERRSFFGKKKSSYMGRGKTYYQFAATYGRETSRRLSGLIDVLTKLSTGFEKYAAVLSSMREEYLNFIQEKSPDQFEHFRREIDRFERELLLREKIDAFLDLYSEWSKGRDPKVREALLSKAEEIKEIDPGFKCPTI